MKCALVVNSLGAHEALNDGVAFIRVYLRWQICMSSGACAKGMCQVRMHLPHIRFLSLMKMWQCGGLEDVVGMTQCWPVGESVSVYTVLLAALVLFATIIVIPETRAVWLGTVSCVASEKSYVCIVFHENPLWAARLLIVAISVHKHTARDAQTLHPTGSAICVTHIDVRQIYLFFSKIPW